MSIIFGIIRFNDNPLDRIVPDKMLKVLNYWNADDTGIWHNGTVGMGHLMLYNTPESLQEKLPWNNKSNSLIITSDARIDNREELFKLLNITDTTIADSILILKSYEKYGEECINHLIGDFAFAIWDVSEQKLFCARDHMGVRPMYYAITDDFFVFASEKKGILAVEDLKSEINEDYLIRLLACINHEGATCYKNIYQLQPAHFLTLKDKELITKKYWKLDINKQITYSNSQEYLDKFNELFEEAVRCRLRSAYAMGVELSGGMDSSAITCIAAELLHKQNKKLAGFAATPPSNLMHSDPLKNDEYYVDKVNEYAGLDVLEKRLLNYTNDSVLQEIDTNLKINDGPGVFMPANNFYCLREMAAQHGIRTLLSGHMGDDLVTWRYGKYYYDYSSSGRWMAFFKEASKDSLTYALKLFIYLHTKSFFKGFYGKLNKIKRVKYYRESPLNLVHPDYFDSINSLSDNKHSLWSGNFKEFQRMNITHEALADRMVAEVHAGYYHKVEPRYPLADIRLLQFVINIPLDEKKGPQERWLFRRAMKGKMPDIILTNQTKNACSILHSVDIWNKKSAEVIDWLATFKELETMVPYLDLKKFLQTYELKKIGTPVNRRAENIIRWIQQRGILSLPE